MKRVLRFFLSGLIAVVVLSGALFGYFVYSPAPEVPRLSGAVTAWHAAAIFALSALIGSVTQGAERTGSDLGFLRATAAVTLRWWQILASSSPSRFSPLSR